MSKQRIAHCGCAKTKIEVIGNPDVVAVCNCLEYQRRTGSVIGVSSYFRREAIVSQSGDTSKYTRVSEGGKDFDTFFCKNCGTTVWWDGHFLPEHIGISVGCFGDPEFPQPLVSVWGRSKHPWVRFNLLTLPFKKQTPTWFDRIAFVLKLPKITHVILSLFSFLKKRNKTQSKEECVLTQIEAILINKKTSV